MAVDGKQIGEAVASPTKSFFVSMLTRDIELQDAILDLLDNCVDGILRTGKPDAANAKPYDGFSAEIIMAKDHFIIRDNCGGIPIETAKKYAFAMGRPEGADALATSATVGMYGIGMKRAMFKLGTLALVESWNDTGFVVEVTPEWMAAEGWAPLTMFELPDGKGLKGNTTITVFTLHEDVAAHFSKPAWIEEFRKSVSQHYSIILEKGFKVSVGDGVTPPIEVAGEPFRLLETPAQDDKAIRPYIYIGKLSGVDVEIYVGLYRQLPTFDQPGHKSRCAVKELPVRSEGQLECAVAADVTDEDSMATLYGLPLDRLNWPHRNSHRLDVVRLPLQKSKDLYEPGNASRGHRVNGKVLPVENRHFEHWNTDPWDLDYGGNGGMLASGTVFLLPYYLGLYHGFIAKP